MPNVPFQVGDGIQIGAAVITASGAAIVLPANTSVGGTQVATSTDVSTGGGPKITNLQITDNSWAVLDDTAVDTAGGYVLITGTNFVSGALVYFNQTPANSVAFVGATTLRVTVPALTAGTYIVYVINPDGGTAIRVPGLTASANPAWQTASALPEQYDGVAITLNLVATDATSYTLTSGSLPPGLSLNTSTGAITGTVSGVTIDTTYTFTVRATDAQLQDSPRTFTVTITVSDPYFRLTTLLLSGSAISANTVIRDSSTNNFNLTVYGDSRASNFTPYGTGWSVYFDGTGDYLSGTITGGVGSGDFTLEYWVYHNTLTDWQTHFATTRGVTGFNVGTDATGDFVFYDNVGGTGGRRIEVIGAITVNRWYHFAFSRSGTSLRGFLDGTLRGTYTTSQDYSATAFYIGALDTTQEYTNGYISNLRLVKGTALYTANFTPATTNLTTVANTSLLTCNVNRFRDSSVNNFTITRNGDARVVSFNPFNITNTGVNGSMYFDGTGDYLSVVDNSAFTLANYNFCIELWIYPTASMANYANFLGQWANSTTNCAYTFRTSVSQNVQFAYTTSGNGQAGTTVDGSALVISSWNHIVVCRNGTTLSIFQNGVRTATHNISTNTISDSSRDQQIGFGTDGSAITGYMSNLRLVTGNSIYDPTLTTLAVPIQPLTAVANTQLLTLQYDQPPNNHTFLDSSSNQFVLNRVGNASQGTFSPFSQSGWSNLLGSANFIYAASNADFAPGTGDFTVEAWVYPNAAYTTYNYILGVAATGGLVFYVTSNTLVIRAFGVADQLASATIPSLNTWTHVAATRSSTTLRIFVNGVQTASTTNSYNFVQAAAYIGNDSTNAAPWYGYISNFRFIKGQALYTGNFTIPTTNFIGNVVGTSGANVSTTISGTVSLLTCQSNRFIDNSANPKTITFSGSPSVQAFSPFAATAVYNPAVHGGSMYLDGTGDYLTTQSSFDGTVMSTGPFSIEVWLYPLATLTNAGIITFSSYTADSRLSVTYYNAEGIGISTAAGWILWPSTQPPANQWCHYVVCRNTAGLLAIFYNGIRQTSTTYTSSIGLTVQCTIGAHSTGFNGYFGPMRISRGVTLYDPSVTTFPVPTAPPTSTANTSLLLNFTDAAILDSTGRNVVESLGDIKSSSVITKFTGASFVSDGSGDYLLTAPTADLEFGSGDFTIELWWYPTSTTRQGIYHGSFGADWCVGIDYSSVSTNQKVGIWASSNGSSWNLINADGGGNGIGTTSLTQNAWNHIAYVRNGTTWMLFVNGNRDLNLTGISGSIVNRATYRKAIGAWYSSGAMTQATGYLADLRITRYARYTANFTAPTAPARLK